MKRDSGAAVFEFFAGGGMARLGLSPHFQATFANDFDAAKARHYDAVFGPGVMRCADVWTLAPADLPGRAALAWASFPCQDLSLAGNRSGLDAPRSGAFWGFWRLIEALDADGRAPPTIALENVAGLLSSNGGADIAAIATALAECGYQFGFLPLDAADFVPQSRPRLFVVATRIAPPAALLADGPPATRAGAAIAARIAALPDAVRARALWWALPAPPRRNCDLRDLVDRETQDVCWNAPDKTARLLAMMSSRQAAAVEVRRTEGGFHVGALFRRIRVEDGVKVQRAEVRFDGLAGCLRTPAGGSSRQTLLVLDDGRVRSRLLSAREAARLMGLPDDYPLPDSQTAALHLLGDGVAAPVVRFIAEHVLAPLARAAPDDRLAA
jgi:DNA (cytosine-5)-methyltransferase 1